MYSSGDLERFYFKYQTEALPHGQSLRSFCLSNKVPYNIFSKWYRDTRCKRPSKSPLKGDFPVQPFSFMGNKRGSCNELLDDMDFYYNKVKCRKIERMLPVLRQMVIQEQDSFD